MKKFVVMFLASGLACATAANAAPAVRTVDLGLSLTTQGRPGVVVTAQNATAIVDTAAKTSAIAAGAVSQTAPITTPVTATPAIASVTATGIGKVGYLATSNYIGMGTPHLMGSGATLMHPTLTNSWSTTAVTLGAGDLGTATPANGSTIALASPTYVNALGNLPPVASRPQVTLIPEPGTLLLFGSGIAGLAFLGRRPSRS